MSKSSWSKIALGEITAECKMSANENPIFLTRNVYGVDRNVGLTSVSKYTAKNISRYKIIQPGWFAYNPMRINIGSIGLCSETTPPGLVSPDYIVFKCIESKLNPVFLSYFIKSPFWGSWISKSGVGSVRTRIYYKELALQSLQLPPLEEQCAIVDVLSVLDEKIELNRQMNLTLDQLVQKIFKNTFVTTFEDYEEKVFLSDLIKETIAGDWGSDTLDDIHSEKVYCVRGADINNLNSGSFFGVPIRYIKKASIEKRKIVSGDIVIELSGGSPSQSTGRSSVILSHVTNSIVNPIVCSNFCRVIRLKENKQSIFVANLLNYYYSKGQFFHYENGTTGIKNFAFDAFALQSEIPKNFEAKIEEFNTLVDPLYIKKYSNTMESDTLTELRDTLLPKLMSGQIRLNLGKN